MNRLNQSSRQLIGFAYKPQVQNDITMIQPSRLTSDVLDNLNSTNIPENQIGGGSFDRGSMAGFGLDNMRAEGLESDVDFMKRVKSLMTKGQTVKNLATSALEVYNSPIGNALRNAIPDSDSGARTGFTGETHMIMKLKNGKNGVANFMGPGTQVIERVKRGDPGRTPADSVAKMHDIQYSLAGNARNKADQLKQVRLADNRMISSLKRIRANRSDAGRNISAGMRLIQAKEIGEDLGILDKQKFAGPLNQLSAGDNALLKSAQSQMKQEGFGILPGDILKRKLIKQMIRQKKKQKGGKRSFAGVKSANKGSSFRGSISGTHKLSPKPLVGAGISQVVKLVKTKIVPQLVRSIGLPKSSANTINKLVPKLIKMAKGNMTKIISNLTKGILPLLAQHHMRGRGIKMSGRGILAKIGKNSKLHKLLAMSIMRVLKGSKGKGLKRMKGKGFFQDFAKGFKSVFVPGAKLLGSVATALGAPEIGIPLTLTGKAIGSL